MNKTVYDDWNEVLADGWKPRTAVMIPPELFAHEVCPVSLAVSHGGNAIYIRDPNGELLPLAHSWPIYVRRRFSRLKNPGVIIQCFAPGACDAAFQRARSLIEEWSGVTQKSE